jgi:hypothetical protein
MIAMRSQHNAVVRAARGVIHYLPSSRGRRSRNPESSFCYDRNAGFQVRSRGDGLAVHPGQVQSEMTDPWLHLKQRKRVQWALAYVAAVLH